MAPQDFSVKEEQTYSINKNQWTIHIWLQYSSLYFYSSLLNSPDMSNEDTNL